METTYKLFILVSEYSYYQKKININDLCTFYFLEIILVTLYSYHYED